MLYYNATKRKKQKCVINWQNTLMELTTNFEINTQIVDLGIDSLMLLELIVEVYYQSFKNLQEFCFIKNYNSRNLIHARELDDFAQVYSNYQFAKCIRIACSMFIDKRLYGF